MTAAADHGTAKDFGSSDVTGTYLGLEGFPFTSMPAHHHAIGASCLRQRLGSSSLWKVIWITAEELRVGRNSSEIQDLMLCYSLGQPGTQLE